MFGLETFTRIALKIKFPGIRFRPRVFIASPVRDDFGADQKELQHLACLVLDIQLPGASGLDLQQELGRAGIDLPIIFVTGHADVPTTVRAMKAGAVEFLTKPYRRQALVDAVRAAIERDRVVRQVRRDATVLRERYEHLTPREREVMAFVVAGLLNKQIAGELDTTERTIKFHRAHIMEKMAAASLPDLVRMAAQLDADAKR